MKYYLQVCLALLALLMLAACGAPDRANTAAQPTPQQAAASLAGATPPASPRMPTAALISEAPSQATTAWPLPPPDPPPAACPQTPSGDAPPAAPNGPQHGQPSIATTACPNIPAEQTAQIIAPDATIAPSGGGSAQVIVAGATVAPGGVGSVSDNNTPTPLVGGRTIELSDRQQTLLLGIGETFELKLGSGMEWAIEIADPRIIARIPGNTADDSQGVYQALAHGATLLTATGDPPCRKSRPACMMPSIAFTLNIIVH